MVLLYDFLYTLLEKTPVPVVDPLRHDFSRTDALLLEIFISANVYN